MVHISYTLYGENTVESDILHMAVFRGQGWHSHVLIKISADERPLNQLTVKNLFFSLIIKTFCH